MNPVKKKKDGAEGMPRVDELAPGMEETAAGDLAGGSANGLLTDAELASMEDRIKEAEDCVAQAEKERDEYLALAQRVKADFDNYRKRNASLRSESFDDGACAFIETVLPVCDNLERALAVQTKDDKLKEGVALVLRQLREALSGRGIETIDRRGEPFDPVLEHAVSRAEPEEGKPGTVAEVLLKGYRLKDRVLRHAMVRVVGDPPPTQDGEQ